MPQRQKEYIKKYCCEAQKTEMARIGKLPSRGKTAVAVIVTSLFHQCGAFQSGSIPSNSHGLPHLGVISNGALSYQSNLCFLPRSMASGNVNEDLPLETAADQTVSADLDADVAKQFTIQVCTSTSCTRRLKENGLDQYNVLGGIYEKARSAKVESCMVIEDGGCQGGRNCKMGPCVAIQHEEFDGNVALQGMLQSEFQQRVFHNIVTEGDIDRLWGCVENAIQIMAESTEQNNP